MRESDGPGGSRERSGASPALEIRGLSFTYPDGSRALEEVSFDVTRGESLAVVGANGAGKSTLLLHLNGYLVPREGTVSVEGSKVKRANLSEVRRMVGMLFQNSDDQLFMPTALQDVAFGPLNMGLAPEAAVERANEALERVGAAHLASRAPYHLSGGEKRAVAIATVLSMDPSIMVMDEPGSGLDPGARRRLIDLLRGLDHTKVIATHDLDMALDLCDRVLVLERGRAVADGESRRVLSDERLLLSCGLELPLGLAAGRRCD